MSKSSTGAWGPSVPSLRFACCLMCSGVMAISVVVPRVRPAPQAATDTQIRTVVDMSVEELLRRYRSVLVDVDFDSGQGELEPLLRDVGEKVEAFFRDFSNTSSKEEVRMERFSSAGRNEDSARQVFNYLILVRPEMSGIRFEEDRVDSKGRPITPKGLKGFFISTGYAGLSMFFHPSHHFGSRFRYLGKQKSEPHAHVIAFAQKPEARDYLAGYAAPTSAGSTPLLFQGFAWVDPRTRQIVRMRTDLLEPEYQILLMEQTTEVQFSEVHFGAVAQPFWLPREVKVKWRMAGNTYRNRHRYSDYKLFSVESYDKVEQPKTKK